ncbi:MAG: hypothetical protein IPN70_00095 [Candidatus Moraniibacteriota bacterium]|nr:MAG: hypothetical protein IPN70_00095 [Candidatus Moranbacteria bacterium]
MSKKIEEMTSEELYDLGQEMGSMGFIYPEKTHHILLGVRNGIRKANSLPRKYDFGILFLRLWFEWFRYLDDKNVSFETLLKYPKKRL